jgi:hypothetical protein
VGQFALQILKHYGYTNIITTASKTHHEKLHRYGAARCFDYRDADVEDEITSFVGSRHTASASASATARPASIAFILDCIGSLKGSVLPISRIVKPEGGAKVAILLPIIVKDAAEGVTPVYEMDVLDAADWPTAGGVEPVGVRTYFYLDNAFLKDKLQSEIMPAVLAMGIVEPNDQLIVEGDTMLERAEKALKMLRDKKVSAQRLVWRVADEV